MVLGENCIRWQIIKETDKITTDAQGVETSVRKTLRDTREQADSLAAGFPILPHLPSLAHKLWFVCEYVVGKCCNPKLLTNFSNISTYIWTAL